MYRPLILLCAIACNGTDAIDDTDAGPPTLDGDTSCAEAQLFPTLTADPANSDYPDPWVVAACDDGALVVESNGIPTYAFVAMTPNGLAAQDNHWEITLDPEVAATTSEIPLLGTAGFALNGLPIYGPNEGGMPDPYGDPIYNGLMDSCLGHTGGNADYHYHALLVQCVLAELAVGADEPDPIIGFAMDGFPIYGSRGCLDEACTEIVTFQSSWETVGDPTTYAWDANVYVEKTGETYLDECNGRIGPDGTYRYHATDGFPYILGCYAGTASTDAGAGDPGDGGGDGGTGDPGDGGPGGGNPPDCSEVDAGLPCCGDDICDGPETADNCAADCG